MIAGNIAYADRYKKMGGGLETALAWLEKSDYSVLEKGNGPLEIGGGVTVNLSHVALKKYKDWEAHKKYADLHFCIEEGEVISCKDAKLVRDFGEYSEQKDIMFAPATNDGVRVPMRMGDFVVVYPEDAHMPGVAIGEEKTVRKIIVKIPV
ncbi:MAG: YhcH/YjgK/YiaL family protein [Lachnospiraceae bacterium]|nr:YhcH/YjgK/YiaL family protein [Lachnospiraceae bacterium]